MVASHLGTDGVDPIGTPERRGGWIFPVLLTLVIGLVAWFGRQDRPRNLAAEKKPVVRWSPSARPVGETVSLKIDFGNGASKEISALPWTPKMTVVDVMLDAERFRPGIRFTHVGQGASGFLTSLDGLAGEGAEGRNWRLEVDGRKAEVSFCLQPVDSGSRVLWTFLREE